MGVTDMCGCGGYMWVWQICMGEVDICGRGGYMCECDGYVWVWKICVHVVGSKLCDFMLGMCVLSCELGSATLPAHCRQKEGVGPLITTASTWNVVDKWISYHVVMMVSYDHMIKSWSCDVKHDHVMHM